MSIKIIIKMLLSFLMWLTGLALITGVLTGAITKGIALALIFGAILTIAGMSGFLNPNW